MTSEFNNYPYESGDVIVLGPEIFVSKDKKVISWKGCNYEIVTTTIDGYVEPNWIVGDVAESVDEGDTRRWVFIPESEYDDVPWRELSSRNEWLTRAELPAKLRKMKVVSA